MNRKVQVFLPIRLRHLTAWDVGFVFVTESCEARGLSTGNVSSCYDDVAHAPHHPNEFVIVGDAALASPFLSVLACVLFFHDASGPPHYLLMKTIWKVNDLVYVFCASSTLVQVTYHDQVSHRTLEG